MLLYVMMKRVVTNETRCCSKVNFQDEISEENMWLLEA